MKIVLSFIISLFFAATLIANCGNHMDQGDNSNMDCQKNCQMKMQKQSKKSCENCDCKMKQSSEKNCKMDNCNKQNCQKMAKANCDMQKNCNMKQNCNHHKISNDQNKYCKMKKTACMNHGTKNPNSDLKKKDVKYSGCGMSVEKCKEMMPYCEFRDGKKQM